jgi:hypothetical protein
MNRELLKKMKYEMPGAPKGKKGPMEDGMASKDDLEVEISLGEEPEMEETGMPGMAEEEGMEEGMEAADLSMFSEEELMSELEKRKAKGKAPNKMA